MRRKYITGLSQNRLHLSSSRTRGSVTSTAIKCYRSPHSRGWHYSRGWHF